MSSSSNPSPGFDPRAAYPHEQETSRIFELKSAFGIPSDRPVHMEPGEILRVDDLQDELMAVESPEGRPPSHDLRIAEWRWLAVAIVVVVAGGLLWAAMQGVAVGWVVTFTLLLGCLLGIGIGPVLYAGLLRGKEEKHARDEAASVVKGQATIRGNSRSSTGAL